VPGWTGTSMATANSSAFPREYRINVSKEHIRTLRDPHNKELNIHHAYVRVSDFPSGKIPDDVNPRSHEKPSGGVAEGIRSSLENSPKWFHVLNRGILVIAERAWYNNKSEKLHIVISSGDEGGLADGATTDRVIRDVKREVSTTDFENLGLDEIPEHLQQAFVHVEIISGGIDEMLVPLTRARNTSNKVQEFALENLGGGFDWLKELIEDSRLRGKIKFRENDPQSFDVRTVLGLLTLFHPKWNQTGKEPVIAYTSKGSILGYYQDEDWRPGFEMLEPVVVEILELYEYAHSNFYKVYKEYKGSLDKTSKLGQRKEVRYSENPTRLPLTGLQTKQFISDGWLYPLLGAFRMLLDFPKSARGSVKWITDPKKFFDEHGWEFVGDICEQSEALGSNANATGKSRPLWNNLRTKMELHRMKILVAKAS
jgi:hypothetical protein